MVYPTIDTTYSDNSYAINISTGGVLINEDGMYSIYGGAAVSDASSPTGNDISCTCSITDGTYYYGYNTMRFPARGTDAGPDVYVVSAQAVEFFPSGTTLSFVLTNLSTTTLNIKADSRTQLIISRVG